MPPPLNREFKASTLPSQDRFLHSKAKYKGFSGPVGSGKTRALCIEALRHVSQYNPGLNGLIGAPTYDLLRDATLETMLDLLENHYPRIRYRYHQQRNILQFPQWGSKIFFRSLEHPERLRGRNLAWFAVDELTYSLHALRHVSATELFCQQGETSAGSARPRTSMILVTLLFCLLCLACGCGPIWPTGEPPDQCGLGPISIPPNDRGCAPVAPQCPAERSPHARTLLVFSTCDRIRAGPAPNEPSISL